jgi:hypothetical protein
MAAEISHHCDGMGKSSRKKYDMSSTCLHLNDQFQFQPPESFILRVLPVLELTSYQNEVKEIFVAVLSSRWDDKYDGHFCDDYLILTR